MEVLPSSIPSSFQLTQAGPYTLPLPSQAAPLLKLCSGSFPPKGAGDCCPPGCGQLVKLFSHQHSDRSACCPVHTRGLRSQDHPPPSSSGGGGGVRAGRTGPQPPGPEGGGGKGEAGLGSSRPSGPGVRGSGMTLVPWFPCSPREGQPGTGEKAGGSALRGGRPTGRSSGPAAGSGRRQRPPCPRHASTHRAAPNPGSRAQRSWSCRSPPPEAGPNGSRGAAREPEGRGGLEEAGGPERRRVRPEAGLAPWRGFGAKA